MKSRPQTSKLAGLAAGSWKLVFSPKEKVNRTSAEVTNTFGSGPFSGGRCMLWHSKTVCSYCSATMTCIEEFGWGKDTAGFDPSAAVARSVKGP